MNIQQRQEAARQQFQAMIQQLMDKGWTAVTIAREISGGDEKFAKTYRPAITQKLLSGMSVPNWAIGEAVRELYEREIGGTV